MSHTHLDALRAMLIGFPRSKWPMEHDALNAAIAALLPSAADEPDWRELTRRLYVELLWCDRQLTDKKVKQGSTVGDALADALAALESTPRPASARPSAGVEGLRQYAESLMQHADVGSAGAMAHKIGQELIAMLAAAPLAPTAAPAGGLGDGLVACPGCEAGEPRDVMGFHRTPQGFVECPDDTQEPRHD